MAQKHRPAKRYNCRLLLGVLGIYPLTGDEETLFLLAIKENLWILRMIGRCTLFSNMENIDRWIEAFQSSDQCLPPTILIIFGAETQP
jgi:hypothetical protein